MDGIRNQDTKKAALMSCRDQRLSKFSEIHEIAQYAIRKYYLKDYPGKRTRGSVKRIHHGGVHVSRTAILVKKLNEFLRKSDLQYLQDTRLTELAAIYHDCENTSESKGDKHKHAETFARDMLAFGYTKEEVKPYYNAIINKHSNYSIARQNEIFEKIKSKTASNEEIATVLLHDADSFEIKRVRRDTFDPNYAYLYRKYGYKKILSDLLMEHVYCIDYMHGINKKIITGLHKICESATNVYLLTKEVMDHAIEEFLKAKKNYQLHSGDDLKLHHESDPSFVQRCKTIEENYCRGTLHTRMISDPRVVLSDWKRNGDIVQGMKFYSLKTIEEHLGIDEKMKQGRALNYDYNEMPKGFKWQPTVVIKKGIRKTLYNRGNAGLLLIDDARRAPLMQFWSYKRNANSKRIASRRFSYYTKSGGIKPLFTSDQLINKTHEMEARRCGTKPDKTLSYWGMRSLFFSETLSSPQKFNYAGIVIKTRSASDVLSAIRIQNEFGGNYPIYSYTAEDGLRHLPSKEIAEILKTFRMNTTDVSELFDYFRRYFKVYLIDEEFVFEAKNSCYSKKLVFAFKRIECNIATRDTLHSIAKQFIIALFDRIKKHVSETIEDGDVKVEAGLRLEFTHSDEDYQVQANIHMDSKHFSPHHKERVEECYWMLLKEFKNEASKFYMKYIVKNIKDSLLEHLYHLSDHDARFTSIEKRMTKTGAFFFERTHKRRKFRYSYRYRYGVINGSPSLQLIDNKSQAVLKISEFNVRPIVEQYYVQLCETINRYMRYHASDHKKYMQFSIKQYDKRAFRCKEKYYLRVTLKHSGLSFQEDDANVSLKAMILQRLKLHGIHLDSIKIINFEEEQSFSFSELTVDIADLTVIDAFHAKHDGYAVYDSKEHCKFTSAAMRKRCDYVTDYTITSSDPESKLNYRVAIGRAAVIALANEEKTVFSSLVREGAILDKHYQDKFAIHYAIDMNDEECYKLCIKEGSVFRVWRQKKSFEHPLHYAAKKEMWHFVKLLLDATPHSDLAEILRVAYNQAQEKLVDAIIHKIYGATVGSKNVKQMLEFIFQNNFSIPQTGSDMLRTFNQLQHSSDRKAITKQQQSHEALDDKKIQGDGLTTHSTELKATRTAGKISYLPK